MTRRRFLVISLAGALAAPGAGPVLFTPQGLRIEGLDLDTLIAVLRILG